MDPSPLDRLHSQLREHAATQSAWWDEIDQAVNDAHDELEHERANREVERSDLYDDHKPGTLTAAEDTQQ